MPSNVLSVILICAAVSVSAQWDASNPRNLTIGVLDNSLNYTKTWLQWVPTFQDYFNTYAAKLNATFRIQMEVHNFDNLTAAAASGYLDMTFTNTGHSATLGVLYGFKPVVSLENMRLGYPQTLFGGVVVTRNDSDVETFADCFEKGTVAAVSRDGFGGYVMQKREALRQGIDFTDEKIFFTNSPQLALSLTNNGTYVCGFGRTDILEDMTKKTPQLTNYLKVVNRKKGAQYAFFPFACSTELYPEWMVMVRSDPNRITPTETELIRGILMAIRTSDPAAILGQYSRWFPPLSTDSILEALYDTGRLQRPVPAPYKPLWEIIIPVTVVGIILVLVIFRTVSRWSQVRFAPKESDECHLALVTVKNLPALWEAYPSSLPAVLASQETMVKHLTRQHGCYFVRKIGDCSLIAGRDATALATLSADLHTQLHNMKFSETLKPDKVMRRYRQGECDARSSLSASRKLGASKIHSAVESTSQSSERPLQNQPLFALSIGLHKGPVHIDYNAEQHVYDYSGPGVDGTATAVDSAGGNYTLATPEFAAALLRGATSDSFTVAEKPGSTLSFILSTALPQYSVEAFVEKKDEEEQESAAAALDAAKHGLSNRRVTILALRLRFPSSSVVDSSISAFNNVDSILQAALADSKGTVIAEADGLFVIAFNALAPVAGQVKRALSCALEVANGVAGLGPEYRVSAGVASGSCLCGTMASSANKAAPRPLVFGSAVQRAMALECLCCGFPDVPLLVGGELREEINALALFQIVTLVAGPNGRVPILAPMSMREGDDGEWMYVLEDGDRANQFREINEAFDTLLKEGSSEKLEALVSRERDQPSGTATSELDSLRSAYDRLARTLPLIVNEPSMFTQPWTLAGSSERRLWVR
jgi:class 3 adenylate cyclase